METPHPTDSEEAGPHPVDLHVGAQLRLARKVRGMSQEALAEKLGITFQQVQKYERGSNRVSASKLYEIAGALQAQVSYFFEGLADPAVAEGEAEPTEQFVHEFLMTPEGLELANLFPKITRARVRRRILDLVRSMAEEEAEEAAKA